MSSKNGDDWATRKKGLPEVFIRAVMSLYRGAKMRARPGSELAEEFETQVGVLK